MSQYYSHLRCHGCGKIPKESFVYACPSCSGILETVFSYDKAFVDRLQSGRFDETDIFPFSSERYVNIGQGKTPLVLADKMSSELGLSLYLKCEHQNPTGSFKDRPVSCGVSKALELGFRRVVVASSGNGASAVSAFAAKAGLESLIFVPESTPDEKVKQAILYGGKVVKVQGPYSNCYAEALKISQKEKILNLTTTFVNPFTLDGDKAVAYELYLAIGIPEAVYVPISAGPLLVGILKGYEELNELGLVDRLPKMVGVQADGCSPVAGAFAAEKKVEAERHPVTVAGGICDGLVGYEQDGDYAIEAIRRSGGACLAIPDDETLRYQQRLARMEGIFVEPSSATAIAAIYKTASQLTGDQGKVVAMLTGHGLKDMKNANIA